MLALIDNSIDNGSDNNKVLEEIINDYITKIDMRQHYKFQII